jgi:hypothetical protein
MRPLFKNRNFQWVFVLFLAATVALFSDSLLPNRSPQLPSALQEGPLAPAQDILPKPIQPLEKPAPQALSNRIVEYHMDVDYLPDSKELKGRQQLTWKNPGSQPVQELYLHLYPNAFESKKTTFMQESGGKLRQDKSVNNNTGGMQLISVKSLDDLDLSQRMEFVQPDDGNQDDHTLLKIRLPHMVKPNEKVTIKTEFIVKLPVAFARMGYVGDFVMAGQWFPKVAVFEPAGTRGRTAEGWNLHQYHGNSEFYADFGIYAVKINVPSRYTVAATGFPIKTPTDDGKIKHYEFYADDVHDFAWSASPDFRYYEESFSTPQVPGVKIKLYLDPKHDGLKSRYLYAAKKALANYSQWYGSYPYSTLSIVVPPEGGNGAGGMEYPTLITAWAANDKSPDLELERVVVHEIGHQFWYGLVATNEFEEAWLDEGFTSYAEDKVMEAEFGIEPNLPVEASYITSPNPLRLNAWDYKDHNEYADNVYTRAKLVLTAIEHQIGTHTMNRVMKSYFTRWKFKHPATSDFQKTLEDVTKTSWSGFFNQYVYGGLMVDYAVERIQTKLLKDKGNSTTYESTVLIAKHGGESPSVPLHFHFADGTVLTKQWDGKEASIEYKLVHTSPIDWVKVDPAYTLVLENKHINNYMKTTVNEKWKVRFHLGISQILETMFSWIAW